MRLLFKLLMRIGLISSGPAVSSITSATQAEGTSLVHTVTLASAVAVIDGLYPFSLSGVTATSGTDYTATPTFSAGVTRSGGTLTVPVGVSSFTITVSTTNDAVFEGTETYSITIGGMTNTGTITDDESAPTIASVSSASATEGSNIVHTVAVTGVAQASRTFALAFSGAAVGGTDYNATPTFSAGVTLSGGNITVPAGVTSFAVTVATINNASVDGSRAYTLTIGGASGTGSISDDETPSPAFTVTMTALSNALGTVTTLAYINGGGGGSFTPSFTMSRDTLKAGGQVYFDASATASAFSTNPEHELTFEWEFGDETGAFWLYGRDLGQSTNAAYGPQATHVFETPGVKTIKLTTTDPMGNSGITTHTVTVNAWAEADTIYVGNGTPPTAGSNGVGFGATYVSATTASAIAALIATGKRIRFDNSATWSITSQIAISNKTGWRIDGFGAGTAPTFNNAVSADWTAMFTTNSGCSDFSFSGLKAVGTQPDKIGAVSFGGAPANHALYHKLEVTGSHEGITAGGCDVLSIVGCNIHDIGASNTSGNNGTYWYGLYNESVTRFAVIGSAVDNIVSGHCVRTPGVARGVYANNTIRKARHGYGGGKGHALTIRGFTNGADSAVWNGLWTEKVVVCDNILGDFVDEGIEPLQLASQNSGDASRHRNIIVERNVISSNLNSCILSEVSSNLTIRSNLLLTNGAPYAIRIANITTVGAPLPSDTKIYNNTVYKTTSANYNGFSAIYLETGTSGTLIANNLAYAPEDTRNGLASTSEGAQSTFICGAGTNTLVGGNSTNSQVKNTKPWAATTPASPVDYAPNSYGLNGGVSVPVFKDLFNATITGTREIGAIQA